MPTALELGPRGWEPYKEANLKRGSRIDQSKLNEGERERILARVREVADLFKTRFGAKKVILFGSMAHKAWFSPDSDIDLAVEGLVSANYWKAWEMAEQMIPDMAVDLIDIESATESLKKAIYRHGVVL
jgi:uncharacterized protein